MKLSPVNQCIYCTEINTSALTDEHIIPFSLDGRTILQKASCRPCAAKVSAVEQFFARNVLGPMRMAQNGRSRRKSRWPDRVEIEVEFEEGRKIVEIPREYHPGGFATAKFINVAPVLGVPMVDPEKAAVPYILALDRWKELPELQGAKGFLVGRLDKVFNAGMVARLAAKIAYCHAIAMLGLEGFDSDLPQFILNDDPGIFQFVGADPSQGPPVKEQEHKLKLDITRAPNGIFVTCIVWLYANWGNVENPMPSYLAVVGKANSLTFERFAGQPFHK